MELVHIGFTRFSACFITLEQASGKLLYVIAFAAKDAQIMLFIASVNQSVCFINAATETLGVKISSFIFHSLKLGYGFYNAPAFFNVMHIVSERATYLKVYSSQDLVFLIRSILAKNPVCTLEIFLYCLYNLNMVSVSLNVKDYTVLQLLRNLAAMNLVEFTSETPSPDDLITAQINEVCKEVDTSLDTGLYLAQMEVLKGNEW